MSKKQNSSLFNDDRFSSHSLQDQRVARVAHRFNRQYQNQDFQLPKEVETMPIFMEWLSGKLSQRIASPFWEIAKPQKNQSCLDIGCGVSFLIYPWRDWQAFFWGQEISVVARDVLNTRAPQLNSKLFKGVELGAAHQLNYPSAQFDLAIATGWSCYFPLDYWKTVMNEVKRILKPGGQFVFDILDPEKPLAEDWAILETYLGAEVFLEPLSEWEKIIKAIGVKIVSRHPGELFEMYKIRF